MEISLIHVYFSYKRVTSWFSELSLCLLFLINNQLKIILTPKRHIRAGGNIKQEIFTNWLSFFTLKREKSLYFDETQLFHFFSFTGSTFCVLSKKYLPTSRLQISYAFFCKVYAFNFTFRSMNHFVLIFMNNMC